MIEDGVKLANLIQIGHNVRIGAHTAIAAGVAVGGSARIGSRVHDRGRRVDRRTSGDRGRRPHYRDVGGPEVDRQGRCLFVGDAGPGEPGLAAQRRQAGAASTTWRNGCGRSNASSTSPREGGAFARPTEEKRWQTCRLTRSWNTSRIATRSLLIDRVLRVHAREVARRVEERDDQRTLLHGPLSASAVMPAGADPGGDGAGDGPPRVALARPGCLRSLRCTTSSVSITPGSGIRSHPATSSSSKSSLSALPEASGRSQAAQGSGRGSVANADLMGALRDEEW